MHPDLLCGRTCHYRIYMTCPTSIMCTLACFPLHVVCRPLLTCTNAACVQSGCLQYATFRTRMYSRFFPKGEPGISCAVCVTVDFRKANVHCGASWLMQHWLPQCGAHLGHPLHSSLSSFCSSSLLLLAVVCSLFLLAVVAALFWSTEPGSFFSALRWIYP